MGHILFFILLINYLLIKKKLIDVYDNGSFKTKEKRIVKKISKTKIAVTYAAALLDAATQKKAQTKVFADVLALRDVLKASADLVDYLTNPLWSESDKKSVLNETAKKMKLSAETLRCLDIIYENRRFGELALILDEFVHLYYRQNNIAEVYVDSAKKISAVQDKKLVATLEKLLAKKVAIAYNIYPELIGGLRVRAGSLMFDDTVASKLNRLEIMMKGEE